MTMESRSFVASAALAAGGAAGLWAAGASELWPAAVFAAALTALFGYALAVRGWWAAVAAFAGLAAALASADSRRTALEAAREANRTRPWAVELAVGPSARVSRRADGTAHVSLPGAVGRLGVVADFELPAGAAAPAPGERWACAGWLARAPGKGDGGRLRLWVRGEGAFARRLAAAPAWSPAALAARARADLSRRVGIGLAHDPESARLNRAILLGERALIGRDVRADFVAAGTVHVFAVSGLHVMVVARVLEAVLRALALPRRFAALGTVPLLWTYVLLIGLPPSALRAALMASLYYAAPLFWRRPNAAVAWSLAFLGVHLVSPESLVDTGSALSFAVMLALVVWTRWARAFGPSRVLETLGVAFAAWAGGTPIAAHVFGRVTPGGLVANLAVVKAAEFDVAAGVCGVLTSFVSERLAAHVNNLAALVTRVMVGVSRLVAGLPLANLEVEPWSYGACFAWYAGLAAAMALVRAAVLGRRRTV